MKGFRLKRASNTVDKMATKEEKEKIAQTAWQEPAQTARNTNYRLEKIQEQTIVKEVRRDSAKTPNKIRSGAGTAVNSMNHSPTGKKSPLTKRNPLFNGVPISKWDKDFTQLRTKFPVKHLLSKTESLPALVQANQKQSSTITVEGESVEDIKLSNYMCYMETKTRKQLHRVFEDVQFDQILLTKNDTTGNFVESEFPFHNTNRNLRLHQDKIKACIVALLDKHY